jgi:uncharacterized protein YceK
MRRLAIPAALALLLGGCGSISDITSEQRIYGGVQKDAEMIGHPYVPKTEEYYFPYLLFGILDLPLSIVVDTVLLPATIAIAASKDDSSR